MTSNTFWPLFQKVFGLSTNTVPRLKALTLRFEIRYSSLLYLKYLWSYYRKTQSHFLVVSLYFPIYVIHFYLDGCLSEIWVLFWHKIHSCLEFKMATISCQFHEKSSAIQSRENFKNSLHFPSKMSKLRLSLVIWFVFVMKNLKFPLLNSVI